MNELLFGLSVALIGMLVVFAGLVLLIGSIKLITLLSNWQTARQETAPSEAVQAEAEPQAEPDLMEEEGVTPEIVAALTAAIAAVWQGDTGFTVRRVRRVHNAPAWNRAGREDQVYSRM